MLQVESSAGGAEAETSAVAAQAPRPWRRHERCLDSVTATAKLSHADSGVKIVKGLNR